MALLRRQTFTLQVWDDQSPQLAHAFVGNWTRTTYGKKIFYNDTITETPTIGAAFNIEFSGKYIIYFSVCWWDIDTGGNRVPSMDLRWRFEQQQS